MKNSHEELGHDKQADDSGFIMSGLRQRTPVFFVLCTLLSILAVAPTQHAKAAERDDRSRIVFANSLIKPWGMSVDGSAQGLLVDVQYALGLETGLEQQLILQPYARVIHSIYSGDVDMAGLFDARVDLSKVIKIAVITESSVTIVGKAGMQSISSIEELRGKLVGHMRGSKYGPAFDDASHFTKVPINTMLQGLAMLYRGRIDAMAGTDLTFFWAIKQKKFSPADFVPLLVISKPAVSLYISKKSPHLDLIPRYRKAMQNLHDTGVINEIFGHSTDWNKIDGWSAPWSPKKLISP